MPEVTEGERVIDSLLGGIRYVRRSPALLGSMALDLFAVFFGGAMALLPIFAADILHVGPVGLGVMRTAPSVGALLVMLLATRWPPTRHAGRTLLLCVAGFGASMIVFGLSTTFWLSLIALFFSGVTDGISVVIRLTIVRVLSPERIRGRVASVNWVFIGASNELGAFESGVAGASLRDRAERRGRWRPDARDRGGCGRPRADPTEPRPRHGRASRGRLTGPGRSHRGRAVASCGMADMARQQPGRAGNAE